MDIQIQQQFFLFWPSTRQLKVIPLFHGSSQMESVRSFEYFAQLRFLGPFASNLVWRVSPPGNEVTIIDSKVPVGKWEMWSFSGGYRFALCESFCIGFCCICWVACQSNDHQLVDDLHCCLSFCPVYRAIIYTLYHTVPCWMAQYIVHLGNSIFVYRIRYNLIAYDAVYFDKNNLHFNVSWQGWPGQGLWVLSNGHCPTRYVGNFNLNIVMIMLKPSPVGT